MAVSPFNSAAVEALETIAKLLELLGENSFKVNAHTRAARTIDGHPDDLSARAKADLQTIDGIGPKIADKLAELQTSGAISELAELRKQVPAGLLEVLNIPGLGPKTVRMFWTDAGVTDLAGLERIIADGSILKLPRMGEKSVAKIRESLAFAKSSSQRLSIGMVMPVAERFLRAVRALPGVERAEVAGSLRRGKETIADVDLLACAASPAQHAEIAAAFAKLPGVHAVLASGESKVSVRAGLEVELGRWGGRDESAGPEIQLDLRLVPRESFGAALMYFTGSKEHNVLMRHRALKRGLTLNEYGLFPNDPADPTPPQSKGIAPVASRDEAEVFRALELEWIPPELREAQGELDAPPPADLIALEDIRAELHAHTTASDGVLSILELAREAKARGFHTIAVTDHSKSSAVAGGLSPERLRQHIRDVREAAAQIEGISILAGSEVDILADGTLDYDDELLAQLDVVVASPHAALSQEPGVATERLLRAIRHPLVHIVGHPTGRLINRRPGLSPAMNELIAAACEHRVALEVNAHWMRLDLRDSHVRAAQRAGCLVTIDCDVHERTDYDNLRFGVLTARRGGLTRGNCPNAWDAPRLHAWLKSKRA